VIYPPMYVLVLLDRLLYMNDDIMIDYRHESKIRVVSKSKSVCVIQSKK
jgi:hypothetical protein